MTDRRDRPGWWGRRGVAQLASKVKGPLLTAALLHILVMGAAVGLKAPDSSVKLSKEDLKFLFGDQDVPPHSVVNIRSRPREKRSSQTLTENPGFLDVTLKDDEDEVEFELRPNYDLISPDFELVVRGEDGILTERGPTGHICYYYGMAKGRPDTAAALSNCDGRGFTGVIVSSNYTHMVRPVKNDDQVRRRRRQAYSSDDTEEDVTSDGLHVIHTRNKDAKCAVFDLSAMKAPRLIVKLSEEYKDEEENHDVTKREANTEKQIETAVFVDDEMYNVMKKRSPAGTDMNEKIRDIVLAIMNGVHVMFNAPSLDMHFTITLVRVDIHTSAADGPSKAKGNIQTYLHNFCIWQKKLNDKAKKGDGWDHALMLSGLDLWDGTPDINSVIGLAWVSGMCHPKYSCTINEGTSFEAVFVISHEMGHNLGMSHDGSLEDKNDCDRNKYLMSPMTGPGKVTWSKCSNNELKDFFKYLTYDCLANRVKGPPELYLDKDRLPGERYAKEHQCAFAEGATFKPYVTSKTPYNDVCRELWCQNTTHALRAHPALEGTSCGVKKFCINGQCLEKPTKAIRTTTSSPVSDTNYQSRSDGARSDDGPDTKPSSGLSSIFRRIRNFFKKYLFLRSHLPEAVFTSQWMLINVTECTAECGGGWRKNRVTCTAAGGAVPLADEMCDPYSRPPVKAGCNTTPCARPSATTPSSESQHAINFPSG